MNKNLLVVVMIVVVLVLASIFLYFVFRSNTQESEQELFVDDETVYTYDVERDSIDAIQSEAGMDGSTQGDGAQIAAIIEDVTNAAETQKNNAAAVEQSPQTGPGLTAAVIAVIVSAVASFVVFKKTTLRKNA